MRAADEALDEIRTPGYTVVPRFVADDELASAQACLWDEFPCPADYFIDSAAHARYSRSQFAGSRLFSTMGWAFNRLAFHPDLDGPTAVVPIGHSVHISMVPVDTWPDWPNQARHPGFAEVIERATVRERDVFGFPRPGDPYWNRQTLDGVQRRYPNMDMTPYGTVD